MGAAALKHDVRTNNGRGSHLRVVPPARTRPAKRQSSTARANASRKIFRAFATVVVVVSLLALGRVWLSVQAAEASMRANELRGTIKSERYEGDMLEVRQSALGSPSRIRAIASNSMDMTSSKKITYLKVDERARVSAGALASPRRKGAQGALARMMDITAGEAQVLLVGSIGLAGPE